MTEILYLRRGIFCVQNPLSNKFYLFLSLRCFFRRVRKIAKSDSNFVMSVRPHGTSRLPLDGFLWNLIFEHFSKETAEKIEVLLKSVQNNATLHEYGYTFLIISRSVLLRMRNISDTSCKGNQNTHFVFSNFFSRKSYLLWYNMENYCRTGQATDDNMVHADSMLDT
jgi:hypothetical protein